MRPAITWRTTSWSSELNRLYPGDDVRSEEGLEHVASEGRLWIVDPLDGTRGVPRAGAQRLGRTRRPLRRWRARVGAVALPALDITLSTGEPPVLKPPTGEQPRLVVSRSRPPEVAYDVAEALGAVMVPLGSAGAKIAAVILGDAEIYVHAGGQYEWDSCAPAAVALASGLHASRLERGPAAVRRPRRLAARSRRVPARVRVRRARRDHPPAPALLVARAPRRRAMNEQNPASEEAGFCRQACK